MSNFVKTLAAAQAQLTFIRMVAGLQKISVAAMFAIETGGSD